MEYYAVSELQKNIFSFLLYKLKETLEGYSKKSSNIGYWERQTEARKHFTVFSWGGIYESITQTKIKCNRII